MTDFSVTNYNPYNIYSYYGYGYPAFRGATVPTDSVTQYNTVPQLTQQPDSVSFSASNQIKPEESKGLSKGAKWALGIAGTAAAIYGGVVAHRAITKPSIEKVAKNFSEIFRRDVSKEEAQKIIEKYADIFKEKDKDKFIQRCFEQAKKDFGYEHLDIRIGNIPQAEIDKALKEGYELGGGYIPLNVAFNNDAKKGVTDVILNNTVIEVNPNLSKQTLFKNIIHELTHAKQHEMVYRMNKQNLFDAIKEARFSLLKDKPYYNELTNEYSREIEKIYGDVWGKLPKINEGSKEYELAKKYLEDIKHYTSGGSNNTQHGKYMEQFVEQEAHGTAPLVEDVYNSFANIWRVPFFQ